MGIDVDKGWQKVGVILLNAFRVAGRGASSLSPDKTQKLTLVDIWGIDGQVGPLTG